MCCTLAIGSVILVAVAAGGAMFSQYSFSLNSFLAVSFGPVIPCIFFYLVKKFVVDRKAPPGPWSFPIIGSLIELNIENAIQKCAEYKEQFGKIFTLNVGEFTVIVINDYKLIQEALKRDEFLGRPDYEKWISRNGGYKNRGILLCDGDKTWQEQRRFALKTLKDFGFGKQSIQDLILHEAQELMRIFKKSTGQAMEIKYNLNCSVFNSLWYILSGQRFELDDARFSQLMTMMAGHIDKLGLFTPAHYLPWPVKNNLIGAGKWQASEELTASILDLMDELINDHLDTFSVDRPPRDFIDVYLHQHFIGSSEESSFAGEEGIRNLRVVLLDLFAAGTETTSTTILWGILYLTKFPEVQRRLHAEMDQAIGSSRLPTREDRPKLPYLEAFTNEVHRHASILPMSVYHKVVEDCNFGGYLFKKDTIVYPNLYDAHHDRKFWGDPQNFKPERFLDASGTRLVHKEALMPFSTGKRICLGETLARDTLFLFLAGLIQTFSFRLDGSSRDVDIDNPKPNFVRSPPEFKVILTNRDTV